MHNFASFPLKTTSAIGLRRSLWRILFGALLVSASACAAQTPTDLPDERAVEQQSAAAATGVIDYPLDPIGPCKPGLCGAVTDKYGKTWNCSCASACRFSGVSSVRVLSSSVSQVESADGAFPSAGSFDINGYRQTTAVLVSVGNLFTGSPQAQWYVGGSRPPVDKKGLIAPSAAIVDMNGDKKPELVYSAIRNDPSTGAEWVYGFGITGGTGGDNSRGDTIFERVSADVPKLARGGGIAVGRFDTDSRPDLVVAGIDGSDGRSWRYRIGLNCGAVGNCEKWLPVQRVDGGESIRDGGISVGDLDGNGIDEIVFSAISTSPPVDWGWGWLFPGSDYWRYRIGTNCDIARGGVCSWAAPQTLTDIAIGYLGQTLTGGAVSVANAVGSANAPGLEIVLSSVRLLPGNDEWILRTGSACNVSAGTCAWGGIKARTTERDGLTGGAATVGDIDGNGVLEVAYGAFGIAAPYAGAPTSQYEFTPSQAVHTCSNADAFGDLVAGP
jgi:hypothetical protein